MIDRQVGHDVSVATGSLCRSCVFLREVTGRRGQRYVLCRNEEIAEKYPQQPVLDCAGHEQPSDGGVA